MNANMLKGSFPPNRKKGGKITSKSSRKSRKSGRK